MEQFEKKITHAAQKIRLKKAESHLLRERIISYMEYHPLPVSFQTPKKIKAKEPAPAYTEQFSYIHVGLKSWSARITAGAFAILLVASVPLAAERAVPGETLYAVKLHVNEEAYASLSFSSYEKVVWETRRVERRIAEARLLAKEGKLTDVVEAQINETVKAHAATAQKELATLRENNADEAAVAQVVLESALDVQSAVLETGHGSTTKEDVQIQMLASTVRDAREIVRVENADEPTLSSYERFSAEVEVETTRAHELFMTINTAVSDDERVDISRRLEDIGRRVGHVRELQESGDAIEAIKELKEVLGDTQKIIAFMTDIDVRRSVTLEELVPKILTDEERQDALRSFTAEATSSIAIIRARMASSTDDGLITKIGTGMDIVLKDIVIIDAALSHTEETLAHAEVAAKEARELIRDMLIMTEQLISPTSEVPVSVEVATSTVAVASSTEATLPEAEVAGTSTPASSTPY